MASLDDSGWWSDEKERCAQALHYLDVEAFCMAELEMTGVVDDV